MPGLDTEDKSKAAKDNVYRIRGKATDWEEIYIHIYIIIYIYLFNGKSDKILFYSKSTKNS